MQQLNVYELLLKIHILKMVCIGACMYLSTGSNVKPVSRIGQGPEDEMLSLKRRYVFYLYALLPFKLLSTPYWK